MARFFYILSLLSGATKRALGSKCHAFVWLLDAPSTTLTLANNAPTLYYNIVMYVAGVLCRVWVNGDSL